MSRRKDYFRDLCKAYPLQKQLQQALEMKMKRSSTDETLQKQYQAVLKQVEQVEKMMHYMKVVHGKMAMDMFVSYYIDGIRQKILHTNIICPYGHYKDDFKVIVLC